MTELEFDCFLKLFSGEAIHVFLVIKTTQLKMEICVEGNMRDRGLQKNKSFVKKTKLLVGRSSP